VQGSSVDSVGSYGIEVPATAVVQENVVTQVGLRSGGLSIWQVPGQGNACDDGRCTRFRRYYLSQNPVDGANATFACDAGFHMASLWEIRDPTQLSYDVVRGTQLSDSGAGPPIAIGWIRTGSESLTSLSFGNCNAWTSASAPHSGRWAVLEIGWDRTAHSAVSPWIGGTFDCGFPIPVWCVED